LPHAHAARIQLGGTLRTSAGSDDIMKLSLAGWSLNPMFRDPVKPLALVDYAKFTLDTFGIDAVELNNIYFESTHPGYLDKLRASWESAGVKALNVAIDEQGDLASLDHRARDIALANYARWIPVASYLGVGAIRANSGGANSPDPLASADACIESFRRLADLGLRHGVKILIENHWGLSFDPAFIVKLVKAVRLTHGPESVGTLVDFGNWPDTVDRYAAIDAIMPYCGAVHAKVNDIDEQLNHPRFDHARCIAIARRAGYDGYLGIEYESKFDCVEGIRRGVRKLRPLMG
jgi:sugar phosphate isomerase/epimerase